MEKYLISAENNLIKIVLNDEAIIDDKDYFLIQHEVRKINKNKNLPLLVISGIGTSSTERANEFMMNEDDSSRFIIAIVIKNLANRINASHYKKITKETKTVEIFSNESEARKWLATFQNETF
ncbi:MAG: hypothetical protein ACK452_12775 [Bacteroidota bacterium]|jgi:hypothetical protein